MAKEKENVKEDENTGIIETENKETENDVQSTPILTDKEIDKVATQTGETLKKEGKIKIKIPIDKSNEKDLIVPVCVNGYLYQLERGKTLEVPESISEILSEAGYI